jgi:hypothetical protein
MARKSSKTQALAIAALAKVQVIAGQYVSANTNGTVLVDFGSGPVQCFNAGVFQPLPGDQVRCLQVGTTTIMLGRSAPKAGTGTVTTVASPFLSVLLSDGSTAQLPFLSSYAATVGDTVIIDWPAGGFVLGKASAQPGGTYVPPATPVAPSKTVSQFKCSASGNYYTIGGSFASGDDVWCSDNNLGCWFYGSSIADTIPNTAKILNVRVYVDEFFNEFPSSLATIALHQLASKSGVPSMSSPTTISAGSGWKDLPNAFGDSLKTGSKKGVGTDRGGYHKFRGRSSDSRSGLLEITWSN